MTNREWLNSLTDEEFAQWLLGTEIFDEKQYKNLEPTPKLKTLKYLSTESTAYIEEWLKKERNGIQNKH